MTSAPRPAPRTSTAVSRRGLLRAALFSAVAPGVALPLIGCSVDAPTPSPTTGPAEPGTSPATTSTPPTSPASGNRVLVAYFSRAGENYSYGGRTDLAVGNTEVLAQMISELIACDTHRIDAAEPYPDGYDATVARNVAEQDADARPAIANPLAGLAGYDTVLLGSPIWNVQPPMIMRTFAEAHDFTGLRVLPFVTYALSGLGSTERVYAEALPGADLGEGLAVRGEEVRDGRPDVEAWLRRAGLMAA